MNNKIFVTNLSWEITDAELAKFFEQAGPVRNATVILNRDTGRSRGFGFVEMASEEGVSAAMQMNGIKFGGRTLVIDKARPDESGKNQTAHNRSRIPAKVQRGFEDFVQHGQTQTCIDFSIGNKKFTLGREE